MAQQYPNYFLVKYQVLAGLSDIREYARKNKAMVLEYFWGDDKVYLIGISGKQVHFKEIDKADSLENVILKYFQELLPGPFSGNEEEKFNSFLTSAHTIYNRLLSPALAGNENLQKLIIIRDGPLLLIPFESLLASTELSSQKDYKVLDYMVQHYYISYAHSANLLVRNISRLNKSDNNKILAFSYSRSSGAEKPDVVRDQSAAELPGTARELNAIAKFFSGDFFQGEDATEQKFKTLAGNFDILHLAVHGKADPAKQFSGSLLFKQSGDSVEDGELQLFELYDLNLKAKLAVLSACESGVGKLYKGEGVFSISRGFDYAGCPSTVMTLWKVSDLTSALIMADFYQELNEGKQIDEALRYAKLKYLKTAHSKLSHPAFWAAFVPTGNMDAIVENNMAMWAFFITLFIGAILVFLILRRICARQYMHRKTVASNHS